MKNLTPDEKAKVTDAISNAKSAKEIHELVIMQSK
ncbi:hypothetical protein JOC36_000524 [Weissella uvarum]|nr:hypothetical protein [Weissella uvarum]